LRWGNARNQLSQVKDDVLAGYAASIDAVVEDYHATLVQQDLKRQNELAQAFKQMQRGGY
jgi:hypothetical protein